MCLWLTVAWTGSLRPTFNGGRPLSRSYGASLPSSLAMNRPSALKYSSRLPVSVYGTGCVIAFLGGGSHTRVARRFSSADISVSPRMITHPVTFSSQRYRNINLLYIGIALRLSLSPRLTLIRLALIRNPESCGGQVSRLPCRYLCLHLLSGTLHQQSLVSFEAYRMLPYRFI